MKRYEPIYQNHKNYQYLENRIMLYEWTDQSEYEYTKFCEWVIESDYGEKLVEWALPKFLKDKIEFVKELAIQTGIHVRDLFNLFMDKTVFKFFSAMGWDWTKLANIMKKGFHLYNDIHEIIHKYIKKVPGVDWTHDKAKQLGEFLAKHPVIKVGGGVVLAGLLIYLFVFGANLGHLGMDFDLGTIWDAFTGNLNIGEFLASPNGVALIISIIATTLHFAIPGYGALVPSIKFIIAVVYTIAKKIKVNLPKGHENEKEVEKELHALHVESVYVYRSRWAT